MDLAPDFDEFIASLIAHEAEFLVVGAYALAFHGAPSGREPARSFCSVWEQTAGLMAVSYSVDAGSFRAQRPHLWSETRVEPRPRTPGTPIFDLHPDGVRVAAAVAPEATNVKQDKLVFIFNFFEELRRIAPVP